MFRINLLPKEAQERRRYEAWYRWVFILAVGGVAIIVAVWLLLMLETSARNSDLQSIREQTSNAQAQSQQLAIFKSKEEDLQKRQDVTTQVLAGRVDIGQVANDVSLVLPDEVWIDLFSLNQDSGLLISADTPRTTAESVDVAYKSIAKTMVRLNELPELYDVWLNTATNSTWSQWATADSATLPKPAKVVSFQLTGKIMRPGSPETSGTASPGAASAAAGSPQGAANAAQGAVGAANNAANSSAGSNQ